MKRKEHIEAHERKMSTSATPIKFIRKINKLLDKTFTRIVRAKVSDQEFVDFMDDAIIQACLNGLAELGERSDTKVYIKILDMLGEEGDPYER